MLRPEVATIADQLRQLHVQGEELIQLVKGLGVEDADLVTLINGLSADLTWDSSVLYHLLQEVQGEVAQILAAVTSVPSRHATSVRLSITERPIPMPTSITVDTTNEVIVLTFQDDHGDVTTAPLAADGSAAVLTGTSDTLTVATVGTFVQAADGTYQAPITPLVVGTFNASATVTDTTGAPIPLPAPVAGGPQTFNDEIVAAAVSVTAGPAGSVVLSLA